MMIRLALRTLFPVRWLRNVTAGRGRKGPSRRLLAAALSGFLCAGAGCADLNKSSAPMSEVEPTASSQLGASDDAGAADGGGADAMYNFTVSQTGEITLEAFTAACDARAGLVQTSANCAGINACRGFSSNGTSLIEHSCKGLSGCGPGMSCVILPDDGGKSGKTIYEEQLPITGFWGCASTCHGQFKPTYDTNHFTLFVRPGTITGEEALARFLTGSRQRLRSIVAFGTHGLNDDGTAYSTMSPYYPYYSVAEMDRVIDYVRTLPVQIKVYAIPGAAETGPADGGSDGGSDGGVAPDADSDR